MNSPANQNQLVSAEKIEAIVSGWPSFKMLTLPKISHEYHGVSTEGRTVDVEVDTRPEAGDDVLQFVFDLSKVENHKQWKNAGVRIEC